MKFYYAKEFNIILSLSALLFCSCTEKKTGVKKTVAEYAVLTLEARNTTTYRDFPATIQGQQVVEIRPMVDGYLENIYVPEGAAVTKGQLLFKIKNPQYLQDVVTAQAAIKSAQADVSAAAMNVEKVRPLIEKDIVSKYELDAAQYTLKSKEAALAQAQATLVNANTNIGYTYIKAPQNGVIGLIPYKIGALVNSGTTNPLTTLSNTGNVDAYFSLNEKQLLNFWGRIPGSTLADKLNALPAVNLVLSDGSLYHHTGKLQTASGSISTTTGTETFKATFPNPLGIIQSGASATVRIPRDNDTALVIPQTATYQLQDKSFVYKLIPGNKVISVQITSSPASDGNFLIINSGVSTGDQIILNGMNISDSTVIKPVKTNADSLYKTMNAGKN